MNEVDQKFQTFIEVAQKLNKDLNIEPILYGSLGLNKLIGEVTEVDDVDILVPDEFMEQKYPELRSLVENLGFELINAGDKNSQDFKRDRLEKVAFAKESVLFDIPDFKMADLEQTEESGIKYKQLTAQSYLELYTFLQTCDYRQKEGKIEKDKIRISAIRKFLESQS